ncbi:MAG: hypothetical protein MHPSP_000836, partial [Paramarteilia canceri]
NAIPQKDSTHPFSLSVELSEIEGNQHTWLSEDRNHFNSITKLKLPVGLWNTPVQVLASLTGTKRSVRYLSDPNSLKPKTPSKSLDKDQWEFKVKEVFARIYTFGMDSENCNTHSQQIPYILQ